MAVSRDPDQTAEDRPAADPADDRSGPAPNPTATRRGKTVHGEPANAGHRVLAGLYYGLLTGLFIAGYTVVDSYAVKVLLMSPILVDYMGNLVRLVLFTPTVLRDRAEAVRLWRLQWKHALGVAVFSPIAYVLVLFAMQRAPLSHVAPAREVSMLFAALIGGHLLREGDRALRLLGAVFIALGVGALAFA